MSDLTQQRTAKVFLSVCVVLILSTTYPPTSFASTTSPPGAVCLPATTTANEMNRVIYQEFPANGPTETAWTIVWTEFGTRGLWIAEAHFTPSFGAAPIQVLGHSGLSNIFLPYHEGTTRWLDLNAWTEIREAVPAYLGPCGTISGPPLASSSLSSPLNNPPRRVLVKEIRDRGLAWTINGRARRGEELLLWSVADAGNYEYITQYGFRDDGTITFRMGSTGDNHPVMPYESHMHNALWYIDVNVAGSDHDSVRLMRHLEPHPPIPLPSPPVPPVSQTAADKMEQINGGFEGFADWKAEEFTGLSIIDSLVTNTHGNKISYDLMPLRTGTARHDESFTHHDFWVTKNPTSGQPLTAVSEIQYESCGVPCYINNEAIEDTDVVVWYMSSNHHFPRDEDQEFDTLGNWIPGIAQVMWSGFDLHPRNFLNEAPLYEPCANPPLNMVAWWPLDEVSGAKKVGDIQPNGNHGLPKPNWVGVANGPVPVTGAVNGAMGFNGNSQYVEIPDNPSLGFGTGDFSIDAWVKAPPNSTGAVLDKRAFIGGQFRGYHLYLANGKPGIQLANGFTFTNYTANAIVADWGWHHLAVTVNRTGSTKEIRWYIDGSHVGTSLAPLAGSLDSSSPLRLGVRSFQLSGFWKGYLDELELFSRVLTPTEIRDIYAVNKCR